MEVAKRVQRRKVRRARFPNIFKLEEGAAEGGEDGVIGEGNLDLDLDLGLGLGLGLGETWAHELTSVEIGSVLLANENLGGVFMQTVVLILGVKEGGRGATGVVINRPLQGNLKEVARRGGNVNIGMGMQSAFGGSRVTFGGPVKPEEVREILRERRSESSEAEWLL